jgi:hypothetical protein
MINNRQKKSCNCRKIFSSGGERGIRTPGPVTVNGFQDRRVKPLCHLSGGKTTIIYDNAKKG